jgi:hypothetical protein
LSAFALSTWVATVFTGLILLLYWLIAYDRSFRSVAETRLPLPVISTHALLGLGGLLLWGLYAYNDEDRLAWASIADLAVVVTLGLIMAVRWIGVYRSSAAPGSGLMEMPAVPPERHFPRPVILIHGLCALATVALVVVTVFFTDS